MPHITVDMFDGRPPELKREYIRELTEATVRVLGCPKEAVTVVLRDVPRCNWGQAGVPASDK